MVQAAACPAQSTDYGSVTSSVTIPATATYRIWTRMMVPNTSDDTYLLQVDGSQCYNVGGSGISANTWTWVAHKDSNTSSKIDLSLTQGSHAIKMIGNKPDVKLDRLIFVSDLSCVPAPNDDGSDCNASADNTPPTVRITAPVANASVSGKVAISATASDDTAVSKVEMYANSALIGTDTSSPYSFEWDSTGVGNDLQSLTAKAFDAAGNIGTDSFKVLVQNGDKEAPTVPGGLQATAPAYNKVVLTWKASTDNVAVAGYTVLRDTVPLANVTSGTTYTDTPVNANSTYSYKVLAYDAAGNKSASSAAASVTTPNVADSQAPSAPQDVTGTSPGPTQINLTWSASTDNIGVVGYDIYRAVGSGAAQKIATVDTTSYGDTNLTPATAYSYYVIAKDGAGNVGTKSSTVQVTTQDLVKLGAITGVITDSATNRPISFASAVLYIGENKHIYQANRRGQYTVRNLKPNSYNVSYRANKYLTQTVSVKVNSGEVVTKNIALVKR